MLFQETLFTVKVPFLIDSRMKGVRVGCFLNWLSCYNTRRVLALILCLPVVILSGCAIGPIVSVDGQEVDTERVVQTSVSAAVRYMKEGKSDRALVHLNRALEADKRNTDVHNALALLYRMTGDKKLEEKHFKLAVRYDPGNSQARNNYASYLFSEGRFRAALFQLKKAAEDPFYGQRELALVNMGRCFTRLEKPDEAIEAYQRAIKIKNNLAIAHMELAVLLEEKGKLRQSNQHLERFGDLARHTSRSLWLGIRLQRRLGDQDALASYELALRNLYPDSIEYRLYTDSVTQ